MEDDEIKKNNEVIIDEETQRNIEKSLSLLFRDDTLIDKIILNTSDFQTKLITYKYRPEESLDEEMMFKNLASIILFTKTFLTKGTSDNDMLDTALGKTYLNLGEFLMDIAEESDKTDAKS